ncbi:exopolyphosphatase [soil metagenome]
MSDRSLIAAVDCGSNSFRLLIGRVVETAQGHQIYPIDSLKEPVRLAAGLSKDKYLDDAAIERGLEALTRFGERLRSFDPSQVRAVATNTLRVAKNAPDFMKHAERKLGFPLEVIGGREEARLVYVGAAHSLAPIAGVSGAEGLRLVVDIGGGSTEFVIGRGFEAELMESLFVGCVSWSRRFFVHGVIDRQSLDEAEMAARSEIGVIARAFKQRGWDQAVGSAGTANAMAELINLNNLGNEPAAPGIITRSGMKELRRELLKAGHVNNLSLQGLKADRLAVLPGGFAILNAVFDELDIDRMETCDHALRFGVMYDLLGRTGQTDARAVTIAQFQSRYGVDVAQAARVGELAARLLRSSQAVEDGPALEEALKLLGWAAALHEVGLAIAHAGYHKHSAYIVGHADMPGFSRKEQSELATLSLAHGGKLGKMHAALEGQPRRILAICLRLAALLLRRRADLDLGDITLVGIEDGYAIEIEADWLADHPLTAYSLSTEAAEWAKLGWVLEVRPRATTPA